MPQTRHRVFVVCVRRDLAATLPDANLPRLLPWNGTVSVRDVIGAMPKLRSRLSQGDSRGSWQRAVRSACEIVDANRPVLSQEEEKRFLSALARARAGAHQPAPSWCDPRGNVPLPRRCSPELREWILDERIERLPNNETRAHMSADLVRYLFASVFAFTFGRSPKSHDFPKALAPNHANWGDGQIRRSVQGAGLRPTLHDCHQPHLQGWSLLHPSRSPSVPKSHREGGRTPPDIPRQLLLPRQPLETVRPGGQRRSAVSRVSDCSYPLGRSRSS